MCLVIRATRFQRRLSFSDHMLSNKLVGDSIVDFVNDKWPTHFRRAEGASENVKIFQQFNYCKSRIFIQGIVIGKAVLI